MAYESVLELKDVYFERIEFHRGSEVPTKFTPHFKTEYKEIADTVFEVKLFCVIEGNGEKIIDIVLVGVFDNHESDLEARKELNEENTVSILFPYLRAEISLITAQPNFPTLNLPVMNINAMLKAQREKEKKKTV